MNTNTNVGQIESDIKSRTTRGLQVRSGIRAGNTASSGSKTKSSDKAQQQVLDYIKS